jgi:serine phosphatase RsbU (regulator of sigma subunit)
MLLVSDGVTETMNTQEDFFGVEGMIASIPALLSKPIQAQLDSLLQILSDYAGSAPQADDITLIGVQASTG